LGLKNSISKSKIVIPLSYFTNDEEETYNSLNILNAPNGLDFEVNEEGDLDNPKSPRKTMSHA